MARNIFGSTRVASQGNLYHYYLPKGIINLQISHTSQGFEVEMASPSVDLIPDPDQNYFLKYTPNAFTNDNIQVSFSPQGFLKHIKTSIEDQTGEFISKVIDLGSSIAQIAVSPVSTRSLETIIIHRGPLDPFNPEEVSLLEEKMKQVDGEASFGIKEIGNGKKELGGQEPNDEDTGFGIYYRPMSTFALTLTSKNAVSRTLMRLPHPEKVHFIGIPIASWVKTDFEIKFEEGGYPESIQIVKPSSALAMIQVPINMVSAILRLPAELFKFRVDLSSSKQQALQQEQHLREQILALERQKLQESNLEGAGAGTRGIFDWSFFKRKEKQTAQAPGQASSGTAANIPSDLEDQLKKIKQDLAVIRRRVNSMDK